MKVLSLWQIWASLVALGEKQWETRSFRVNFRGPLLIHAGRSTKGIAELNAQAFSVFSMGQSIEAFPLVNYARELSLCGKLPANLMTLPFGQALCVVNVTDCQPTEAVRGSLSDQERAFGDYTAGRYAIRLENLRVLKRPIWLPGQMGLFNCKYELDDLEFR